MSTPVGRSGPSSPLLSTNVSRMQRTSLVWLFVVMGLLADHVSPVASEYGLFPARSVLSHLYPLGSFPRLSLAISVPSTSFFSLLPCLSGTHTSPLVSRCLHFQFQRVTGIFSTLHHFSQNLDGLSHQVPSPPLSTTSSIGTESPEPSTAELTDC